MRVLLPTQEYPPETAWGGIGTYAGLHARALAAAGHEVHVLSVVREQAESDVEQHGVQVHRRGLGRGVRGPGRLAPQAWRRFELAAAVRSHARSLPVPDIVEAPEWMAESLLLRGAPLAVRLHSSAAQVFPFVGRTGPDARAAIWLEERGITRADLLIASAVQVETRAGRQRPAVVEIPYPVGERAARRAWTDGPPRIVFAGRFEHRKGPDRLVAALPLVLAARPDVQLELIGRDTTAADGRSVRASLSEAARSAGVGGALRVREAWGADAVEAALSGAAVCAVPSRWESFGYVAAEALAGATPTVVSDWPSLRMIGGEHAVSVAGDTPEAWAQALLAAIEEPGAARARAEAGRLRLIEHSSPAIVAERTVAAYSVLLNARAATGR